MSYRKLFCVLLLMFMAVHVFGQKLTREQYINKYKDIAIKQMRKYRIPASITLAQGCLESTDCNSVLARRANNHFGIKCHNNWKGERIFHDDDEKGECFRKYKDVEISYRDHSDFLRYRDRYKFLFDLELTDYKGWANGLRKAGYATDPSYPKKLIKLIFVRLQATRSIVRRNGCLHSDYIFIVEHVVIPMTGRFGLRDGIGIVCVKMTVPFEFCHNKNQTFLSKLYIYFFIVTIGTLSHLNTY